MHKSSVSVQQYSFVTASHACVVSKVFGAASGASRPLLRLLTSYVTA